VLDLVRIFNECRQIKDLNDMIRQKTDEITKEAEQRRQVIESKQFQLREAFQPGTPDYEVRRKELMRLNIEANVWFKMEEEDIERQRFYWTRVIYQQSVDAAAQVAEDRGFEVVIQRTEFRPFEIEQSVQTLRRLIQERAVVYSVPEIGITDEVIRRLDAGYAATGGKKQLGTATPPTP
jgi:Skp family chaperone for outer membrane proteins